VVGGSGEWGGVGWGAVAAAKGLARTHRRRLIGPASALDKKHEEDHRHADDRSASYEAKLGICGQTTRRRARDGLQGMHVGCARARDGPEGPVAHGDGEHVVGGGPEKEGGSLLVSQDAVRQH
jgi:hypothetical protein